ncbi:methyl-accepting chemotaxis protein [Vibrio genomosp. F10 str. 9ZC157]|uniref:Chemotaxis protein n=1 Tax=Vibrio genomosp. F10 str. ZF-129 TaxID=1187848 RepID=A0A1E5B9S0_9VIBR|nr:methyl-accepting chemotaxis protein [Vibrio genomosp. F10]OEE30652.1 chemotaxis protein [Vibrio genomosp. F10 str. ZF-129]OEE94804.1 chemotaxis protein [Vibrio genomosp. F10 str. 9ZC157]
MKLGFKSRIYFGVGALVAASLIVLGTLNILAMRDNMVEGLVEKTSDKLSFHVSELEQMMQFKTRSIKNGAKSFNRQLSSEDNQRLVELLAQSSSLSNVIMTYEDGRAFMSLEGEKYDFRQRDWYQNAKNARDAMITGVYQDQVTQQKVVSVTTPVIQDGQFIGVLLGDVQLGDVVSAVSNMRFAGGAATLTDNKAVFFASDDPNDIGKTPSQISPNFTDMERAFFSQQSGNLSFPYLGIQFDGYFERVNLSPDMYWTLMVFVDKESALTTVYDAMYKSLMTGTLLLLVSFGAIFIILQYAYRPLLKLKRAVLDLSNGTGDLTQRLKIEGEDDLAQISQGFNRFVENLQEMMLQISQASQNISVSAKQLGATARENKGMLVTHSSETEQVVTAITEMSESARTVAENVNQSNRITEEASKEAESSLLIVNNAVSTVSALVTEVEDMSNSILRMNQDANKISNVLNVIGEISEQTNLLALNAAIEAARAGEQGRGFAVVADEVRALAGRTQNSTMEISEMLSQLLGGTESVVKAMDSTKRQCQETADKTGEVSESLTVMSTSVKEIDDVSTQIAAATEEQSTVAEELSRNMLSIRDIVESLVNSGQQTVQATELLNDTNDDLKRQVANFKLS